MCEVKKNVDGKTIEGQLKAIAKEFAKCAGDWTATLVMDEQYRSITAICGNQVLCINFMN